MHNPRKLWWGIVLIVLGVLLLLDNMNGLDIGYFFHRYWPLLLVIWGISILLRNRSGPQTPTNASQPPVSEHIFGDRNEDSSSEVLNYSNVFGDIFIRSTSQLLRGGTVSTVFGETEIDLRSAALVAGESTLNVSGVFGKVLILLSGNVAYSISASATFGKVQINAQRNEGFSSSLSYETPQYSTSPARLRIRATQVFGEVIVRS